MGLLSTIGTLFMVIAILVFAWWCTRKLAMGAQGSMQSRYMKLIDRIMISQDKSVLLVQIGEKYYVLGAAASAITVLAELEKDQIAPFESSTDAVLSTLDFKEMLQKLGGKGKNGN